MGGIKVCGPETNINLPLLLWNITEVGSWLRFERVNVSGGFAFVQPDFGLSINAVEDFSPDVALSLPFR
jgi:hypothetical protein